MKTIKDKLIDFIVEKRYYILVLFTMLSLFSLFLSTKVNINYDISAYLPDDSETRIGKNIMEEKFDSEKTSNLNLMFKCLESEKKLAVKDKISKMNGVKEVEYDETEDYNKDDYTLYAITLNDTESSKVAASLYNELMDTYSNYELFTSGSVSEWNKPVLHLWIIALAIASAVVILIIMCESFIEPFLYLYTIGLAVLINMGSNIIFPSVSHITNSIAAILQLALSMDYSIMLMNRYNQEREKEKNKEIAMKKALVHATSSIASSSVTTIVGLLALVFMSFTIGADLGFVLAKGVFLSLISIFLTLPALILLFDKIINKTKKKGLNINMSHIGKFIYNLKYPALIIFILLFGISFFLKDGINILYTGSENDEIAQVFKENNQIAIIYKSEHENTIESVVANIDDENIPEILAYSNTIGESLAYSDVTSKLESLGLDTKIESYLLKLVYYNYYNKDNDNSMTVNEFVTFVNKEIMSNKDLAKNIDKTTKDNLKKLENFSDSKKINAKRNTKDIANILGIDNNLVKDIFVLYNAKNNQSKMRLDELMTLINTKVLTNNKYSSMISTNQKQSLKTLSSFTKKDTINQSMNATNLASLFGLPEETIKSILLLSNMNEETDITLNQQELIAGINSLKKSTNYLDGIDLNSLLMLEPFITNKNNLNHTKLGKTGLKSVFNGINPNLVDAVYQAASLPDDYKMSPYEFLTFIINNLSQGLDEKNLNSLKLLKTIMETNTTKYKASEMAALLGLPKDKIVTIYNLIGFNRGYEFKMSPKNLVNVMLNQKEILANLSKEQISTLELLNKTMTAVNNNQSFTAKEISNMLGLKESDVSLIYSLATSDKTKMSLNEFTNFILSDVVNNNTYKKYFNTESKTKLEAVKKVLDTSLKKEKLSATKIYVLLSKLSGSLDKNIVELVYLYNGSINDFDESYKLTLEELVNYLNKDVLNNPLYQDFLDKDIKDKIINADSKISTAKKLLVSNGYSRVILNTKYSLEGENTFDFLKNLKSNLNSDEIYVIGESAMAYEMSESFNKELNFITILTMIAIFVVVAFTFKSVTIPLILVLIIQCAVYITMSILSLTGTNVYFISLLIVQSILMGATIDYAIVYTTYYIEMRKKKMSIKESIIESYNKSYHTILCSSSILVIVTLIVGNFASMIAAKICMTLSKGCLCATLLILLILPPLLAIFDRFIIKE